jgi:hypothetical protein
MIDIVRRLVLPLGFLAAACSSDPISTQSLETDAPVASTEVEQPDSVPALLALDFPGGQVVSFHELGDVLVMAQRAPNGVPSVFGDERRERTSIQTIFEQLRPGEAVPAKLLEAVERTSIARAKSQASISELEFDVGGGSALLPALGSSNGVGTLTEAITTDYFRNTIRGCGPWSGVLVWQVCYPEWGNGFYAYAKSKSATWRVASINGSFNVKITAAAGGTGAGVFYVGHDEWHEYHAMGELCCWLCGCLVHPRTLRIDVINATNDAFHVGGAWW